MSLANTLAASRVGRKLRSFQGLERQVLSGTGRFDGAGLWAVDVPHDGNRNYSEEEIDAVDRLVAELTREGARWTDASRAPSTP